MTSPNEPEPRPLRHHVPKSPYRRGATLPARVVAGTFCICFVVVAIDQWRGDGGGSFSLRSASVVLNLAVSAFCLFVALGRIGRHKDGWI